MRGILTQDDRMAALLADAMTLSEAERLELSHWLSVLVRVGVALDPKSVRAVGNEGVRALFRRSV